MDDFGQKRQQALQGQDAEACVPLEYGYAETAQQSSQKIWPKRAEDFVEAGAAASSNEHVDDELDSATGTRQ